MSSPREVIRDNRSAAGLWPTVFLVAVSVVSLSLPVVTPLIGTVAAIQAFYMARRNQGPLSGWFWALFGISVASVALSLFVDFGLIAVGGATGHVDRVVVTPRN